MVVGGTSLGANATLEFAPVRRPSQAEGYPAQSDLRVRLRTHDRSSRSR